MACPRCRQNQNTEIQAETSQQQTAINFPVWKERLEPLMLILCGIALFFSFLHIFEYVDLAWLAILYCGFPIFREAVQSLVSRKISVDVLISTAITACIAAHFVFSGESSSAQHHEHSYIFAAGEVAFIMAIGHWLEERTIAKARAGIEALIKHTPNTARRIANGGDNEEIISAAAVEIGDILRVLPGETIPVDGEIISGSTSLDQSVLTGEPLPVDKTAGDDVFSGTINRFGSFTMRAMKTGQDSSLARMIKLIEEAEQKKSPAERTADKWAGILVPIALLTAVLVTAVGWYFTGSIEEALKRGITILVVFCPCSLVLAAPTAVIAAVGNASRRGILIRSGEALEQLGGVNVICFDKTGTLTKGEPVISGVVGGTSSAANVLPLIASIEKHSEHPLAQCIVKAAQEQQIDIPVSNEFQLLPGYGISAEIDGQRYYAGNAKLMNELNVKLTGEIRKQTDECFARGETVIYLAGIDNAEVSNARTEGVSPLSENLHSPLIGFLSLSDSVRETSKNVIEQLNKSNITTGLLTGDNRRAAENIAAQTGIQWVEADLLPAGKVDEITALHKSRQRVAMVGDGLNDAAALKSADVGIAMGKIGSDLTIEAADIVLVGDDIARLPFLIQLARKTKKTITGNICLSMGINALAVLLAAMGILGPVLGALVHNAGSLFVVFNASLLLRVKE
ncbi:heavy metal translocating P-type ATPase [Planctomycetales bacterium]|nr:heavy metal translocating P-type ATPase [Planctomycetales bacterium]